MAGRHVRYRLLAGAPPGGLSPCLLGDARGHAVQPVAKPFGPLDRAGLARQHQEGRLEGVLGILLLTQHAAAHAQDQRAVALHQRGKGVPVKAAAKALQQVAVRQLTRVAEEALTAKVAEEAA